MLAHISLWGYRNHHIAVSRVQLPSYPDIRYATGLNQLIGALRVRTLRVSNDSCTLNHYIYEEDAVPQSCWATYKNSRSDSSPFGLTIPPNGPPSDWLWSYVDCKDAGGPDVVGKVARYTCGGHLSDITFNVSRTDALTKALQIVEHEFVDELVCCPAFRFVVLRCIVLYCVVLCCRCSWLVVMCVVLSGAVHGECHARSAHAVRTQCEVLDVGKYSNPSFGPLSQVFGSVPGFFWLPKHLGCGIFELSTISP